MPVVQFYQNQTCIVTSLLLIHTRTLDINITILQYIVFLIWQVIVHEPGTIADPINQGFTVAPGVSVLASVSKKRVKVKKEKKSLVLFTTHLILNTTLGNGVIFSITEISKGVKKVALILSALNSSTHVHARTYID